MSRIQIVGNISGTGTVTIQSPNTNSDSTISLPTNGGQMVAADPGTAGNVLVSTGTAWASGPAPGFASGTSLLFVQTNAPTGWTKSTTHNNKALRVVSGTAGSGGSVDFTTAFASQTPAGTVSVAGLSVGSTTLTTAQMPSHSHNQNLGSDSAGGAYYIRLNSFAGLYAPTSAGVTGAQGSGGSHNHSLSGSASFTGSAINLAVQYVDTIIAVKD